MQSLLVIDDEASILRAFERAFADESTTRDHGQDSIRRGS